jgi:hypothetical protein
VERVTAPEPPQADPGPASGPDDGKSDRRRPGASLAARLRTRAPQRPLEAADAEVGRTNGTVNGGVATKAIKDAAAGDKPSGDADAPQPASDSPQATMVQTKVADKPAQRLISIQVKKPDWLGRPGWLPALRRKARPGQAAQPRRVHEAGGRAFGQFTVVPAICVASWLVTGLPLLLRGDFLPVPVLLISAPLATAVCVNVLQRVPSQWPAEFPGKSGARAWMPWFGLIGTAVAVVGFVAWQLAKNSPSVIATRTPGAFFQTGYWLAQHGSLPISGSLAAFGGAHPGLHLSSIGFFGVGHNVVPGVQAGLPMLLAAGFWTSGVGGGSVVMPVLGGIAVFTFGGLVGRLAGPQWAPAGAVALALTAPELYTSRDAFSEPAVQVLLFGGLCLLVDALTTSRSSAAVAGASGEVRAGEDSVTRTLRLADAVIGTAELTGSDDATAAETPQAPGGSALAAAGAGSADESGMASDETAPIPALPAEEPASAGLLGRVDRFSRQAEAWLGASSRRLLARLRAVNRRTLGSTITAGLTPERMLAACGGVSIGLTSLLSVGSLLYLIPIIAVVGVLLIARRAATIAFTIGICVGCVDGIAAAYLLARPFADSVASTLKVIGADAAGTAVLAALLLVATRRPAVQRFARKALAARPLRWLPGLAGFIVIVALAGFAARPYLEKVRGVLGRVEAHYVAYWQRLAGLRIDPTRLYSEDTLYWVIWYAGIATVLLAGFGAAVLVRRSLRSFLAWSDSSGAALNWALPLAIVLVGSAAVLWQPFTVPDQPWASRRLVPVVVPGMILLATWAAAWLTRRARDRGAGAVTAGFVSAFCVGAMVLPAFTTSFGLGLTHSGVGGGFRLSSNGIAQHAVGAGETAAVRGLCAAIGRSSSVVILDQRVAQNFTQVIRGMCGVPAAWMPQRSPTSAVDAVIAGIARAHRRAVLLGAKPAQVARFGGPPTLVMKLVTTQYPHDLTQAAGAPVPVRYVIWMAVDRTTAVGI